MTDITLSSSSQSAAPEFLPLDVKTLPLSNRHLIEAIRTIKTWLRMVVPELEKHLISPE